MARLKIAFLQLSKWKLAAGVLTIVMGGLILAWPGPSILVASTLLRVYLPLTGFIEPYLAFTLTRSAGIHHNNSPRHLPGERRAGELRRSRALRALSSAVGRLSRRGSSAARTGADPLRRGH